MAAGRSWAVLGMAIVAAAACHMEDPSDREIEHPADTASVAQNATTAAKSAADSTQNANSAFAMTKGPGAAKAAAAAEEWAVLQVRIAARADSTDRMLRKVPGLTRWEKMKLRRDVNMIQISRARQLGITPGSDPEQLLRTGRLVKLEDNTRFWILHNLNYSVPYVTPSTESLVADIAQRFQAELDTVNVPRYRLVITSVLRTADKQAALRKANANASKIVSAHEFGTTLDIAYRRFAAPIDSTLSGTGLELSDSLMVKTASLRAGELQAVLGRVLSEMEREGKVMVMMERNQTVYHITVAQPYARPQHVAAE